MKAKITFKNKHATEKVITMEVNSWDLSNIIEWYSGHYSGDGFIIEVIITEE